MYLTLEITPQHYCFACITLEQSSHKDGEKRTNIANFEHQ